MLIADTRLSPIDEANLRWLLCEAPGELGEKSALGGQLDRLQEGRVSAAQVVDAHDGAIDRIAKVELARRLERVLTSLRPAHRQTLRAALGPGLPAGGVGDLDQLGTVAVPVALLLLMADREGVSRKTLHAWVRPPAPPAPPVLPDDAPESDVAEAQKAHADALKVHDQLVAEWRKVSRAGLAGLRKEAGIALIAASHAFTEAARKDREDAPTPSRRIRIK